MLEELPIFNDTDDIDIAESAGNLTSQRNKAKKNRGKRKQLNRSATTPQNQRRNSSTAHKINNSSQMLPPSVFKSTAIKSRGRDRSNSAIGHKYEEFDGRKRGPNSFKQHSARIYGQKDVGPAMPSALT